jgi:hypothetical protein
MDDSQFGAADGKAFAQAHAGLLKHADIQFAFPTVKPPVEPEWLKMLGRWLHDNWTFIEWGLWIAAGIIVAWVVYSIVRQYWRPFWRKRKDEPRTDWPQAEPWRPAQAAARQLLAEADALAAEGRYSEAVHLILLRSIEEIDARRPRLLRRALTSREIGALTDLPFAARPAFARITRAVERARFAGLPVDAAEFARCRGDYEAFAFPALWQLAA